MFSRRLLRIKVLQALYSFYKVDGKTSIAAEKDLLHSIHKTYSLYYLLMLLLVEVVDYAGSRITQAMHKHVPTFEDLHPNTRFIENKVLEQLRNNGQYQSFLNHNPLSWAQYPEIVRNLYRLILDSPFYQEYMSAGDSDYRGDKQLLERICLDLVMNYEDLYVNLEEQSIFWVDDVDFVIKMIVKTLKKFQEDDPQGGALLPMFHDEDDLAYCKKLLRSTLKNGKEYLKLIEASANNWELERIAFTDNLILQLAISEAIEFQSIPTKVTINEFIEIAKAYSTHKSSQFVNGILDNILNGLKAEGRIVKSGRGLIGEI